MQNFHRSRTLRTAAVSLLSRNEIASFSTTTTCIGSCMHHYTQRSRNVGGLHQHFRTVKCLSLLDFGFVCRRPFNNVINDKRHLSSSIKASTRSKNSVPTSFPGSSPSIWERGGTCLRNLLTPNDAPDRRSFLGLNRINVSERVTSRLMFSK